MKKIVSCFLISLALFHMLTSCRQREERADDYVADYPEMYTPEYCMDNYVGADENLIHVQAAENSIGKVLEYGVYYDFYAIKDVPMEEYLSVSTCAIMFDYPTDRIVKNKNLDRSEQEILAWEIKSVELYWTRADASSSLEYVAALDSKEAALMQSQWIEYLENGKYKEKGGIYNSIEKGEDTLYESVLRVRVSFSKYENIVWEAGIKEDDGEYYVHFDWFTAHEAFPDGYFKYVYLPIGPALSELVDSVRSQ